MPKKNWQLQLLLSFIDDSWVNFFLMLVWWNGKGNIAEMVEMNCLLMKDLFFIIRWGDGHGLPMWWSERIKKGPWESLCKQRQWRWFAYVMVWGERKGCESPHTNKSNVTNRQEAKRNGDVIGGEEGCGCKIEKGKRKLCGERELGVNVSYSFIVDVTAWIHWDNNITVLQ